MKRLITTVLSLCVYVSMILGVSGQVAVVYRTIPPRIIQANLVASYGFGEGWNQLVFNKTGSSGYPNPVNLFGVGSEQFASDVATGDGWAASAVTLTDFYDNDPSSNVGATRLVASASSGALLTRAVPLTAGNYTVSCYVKSNNGSTQHIRFIAVGIGNSSDKTVSTSWTQVSWTFTETGSAARSVGLWIDTAGDALDIVIQGAGLYAGNSTFSYTDATFDQQLGSQPIGDSNDPTWSTFGLNFAASQYAYGVSTNANPTTLISVYAVVKKTGSDISSGMEPIISERYGAEIMHLGSADQDGAGGGVANVKCPVFMFGGSRLYAYGVILNDNAYHVLTGTYDGATQKLYLDGTLVGIKTISIPNQLIHRLYLGRFDPGHISTRYFPGTISGAALYSSVVHDSSTIATNVTAMQAQIACRSVAMTKLKKFIEIEGDSLTDPLGAPPVSGRDFVNGWAYQVLHSLSPTIQAYNAATSGSATTGVSGTSNILLRRANIDATCDPTRTFDLAIVFIGANDLNSGISASDFVANVKSWASAVKANCAGRKVLIATLLPQTNPVNTLKDAINALLVADSSLTNGTVADGLVRLDLEPHIGPNAAASDTSLYSDGEHLTVLGQSYAAAVFLAAVNALHP